ncbi:MAG: hypothetical protein IKX74_06205, partial [Erysipelotrichaceae bacterium]|nr:hypothetical protein [Erysipelotrichaceae bacterium]
MVIIYQHKKQSSIIKSTTERNKQMMKKKRILLIIAVCFIMTTFGCTSNEPKEVNDIDATVTIKMPNGTSSEFSGKYTGMAVKNVPNGKGVFISHNSDDSEWKYVGEFEEGRAVGKAQVENFQITLTFSGQRKEGLYSGDFSNGLPDGEGV